jgi:hypothetical protein
MLGVRKLPLGFGIALVLLFLLANWSPQLWTIGVLRALSNFLNPGLRPHPTQWILVQAGEFLTGGLGLAFIGAAFQRPYAFPSPREAILLLRSLWRETIWAVLLAGYVMTMVSTVLWAFHPYGNDRDLFAQVGYWFGLVLPISGGIVCARLVLGRRRHPADRWLGYIMAIAALYGLAMTILKAANIGNPFIGLSAPSRFSVMDLVPFAISIGFAWAAAWTGLFMAHRAGFVALPQRRRPASIIYLSLGALCTSIACNDATRILYFFDVFDGLALVYCLLSVAFLAVSLTCLVHVLQVSAEPRTETAGFIGLSGTTPAGPVQGLRATVRTWRFWRDVMIGFVLALGLAALGFAPFLRVPVMLLAFMVPLLVLAATAGPIGVFIFGFLRNRLGYSLGAVLLMIVPLGFRTAHTITEIQRAHNNANVAEGLTIYPFAKPTKAHDIVVIEDSWLSKEDSAQGVANGLDRGCWERCELLLLQTGYAIAITNPEKTYWRVFRKGEGAQFCGQPPQLKSYLRLLSLGRPNTCFVETRQAPAGDALVLREGESDDAPLRQQLPKDFRGAAWEFLERIDGKDRLLGRIVVASKQNPNAATPGDAKQQPPPIATAAAFYATALALPQQEIAADPAHTQETLTAFLPLLRDPTTARQATEAYLDFLRANRDPRAIDSLHNFVAEVLEDPDPRLVRLGYRSLYAIRTSGLDFAKPALVRGLASSDADLLHDAASALNAFEPADPEFAKDSLATLIVGEYIAADPDNYRALRYILAKIRGPYPEARRTEAKRVLEQRSDLGRDSVAALLTIVGCGDAKFRQEAVDIVFRMKGQRFEQAVDAIGLAANSMGSADETAQVKFWSTEEMQELARRAAAVPNDRLRTYIGSFQFQMQFREVHPVLDALLDARIGAPNVDPAVAEHLKDFKKILDRY